MVQRTDDGPRVHPFARIHADGGGGGDVADIVGARAARQQADFAEPHHHFRAFGGRDHADLQIRAGGDVDISAAAFLGDGGHLPRLMRGENAARDAQAAHEGILRGADEEQAVEAADEIVDRLRELPGLGARGDFAPAIQRVLLALCLFLRNELSALRNGGVLRGAQRIGGGGAAAGGGQRNISSGR